MGAAGLLDIKRRIRSVTNTKKITKAMGLVATSKLRKAKSRLNDNKVYYDYMKEFSKDFLVEIDEVGNNILINGNGSINKLFILISSDMGLCGGFNGNAANYLENKYRDSKSNISTIIVGKRGIQYSKKYKFDTLAEYVDIGDTPTSKEAAAIVNKALGEYVKGNFGEVSIIYTKFQSPVLQEVVEEKLLPIELDSGIKSNHEYTIESKSESSINMFVSSYLKAKVIFSIYNSQTSEQNARMQAMDGATKNADDILNNLHIKYNRIRQSVITQEISEIVGGAEAQR